MRRKFDDRRVDFGSWPQAFGYRFQTRDRVIVISGDTHPSRARPKLLLLYHQLYWGATDEELVAEISRRYHGPIVSARDLGIY